MPDDLFAQYALKADEIGKGLVTPAPIVHTPVYCDLSEEAFTPISPMPTISDDTQLKAALAQLREKYKPFLAELAPKPESKKQVISLRDFLLDGEPVRLPHYGGPASPATRRYVTEFMLPEFSGQAVYFCCGGADYIATVYVNGQCVGIHEGFFSPFEYEITAAAKPGKNRAEVWIEVENATYDTLPLGFSLSLYGQNFSGTVFENLTVAPSFNEKPLPAKHGKQVYKLPIEVPNARTWSTDTPWLYQLQVTVRTEAGIADIAATFGMRSFTQDVESDPKGMFYLNGKPIRLRGANTMGFEQLDVMRGDYGQLIDDILLTKLCDMNYWRITQRPVQREVYDYCDKLGLLTQTDFPLFGVMRRTKSCEAIRQVEEMARLVRRHPCNILFSYMNEPWANANNEPHRHMLHHERETLYGIFDQILRYSHPDAVIKHVDGDFDPPTAKHLYRNLLT